MPERISRLINLVHGVAEHRFDLPTNKAYMAFRIGLPHEFRDAANQRSILFLTCPQALLCLLDFPKVGSDSKNVGLIIQHDANAREKTGYASTVFGDQDRLNFSHSIGERLCGGLLYGYSLLLCDCVKDRDPRNLLGRVAKRLLKRRGPLLESSGFIKNVGDFWKTPDDALKKLLPRLFGGEQFDT